MTLEAKANSQNIPKGMRHINTVNWFKGIGSFIKDSKNEIKRITWPERPKVIRSTTVVLVTVLVMTGIIWVIDSLFNVGLGYFLNLVR